MAVPRQLTQIAFAAPLDESTEDEVLDPTVGFPVLQNVRQDKRGGVSKRLGYGQLASYAGASRLVRHKGRPCIVADGAALVYSDTLGNFTSANGTPNGNAGQCSVQAIPLPATVSADSPVPYDAVVCNGFLILAHSASDTATNPRVSVYTATEDAPLLLNSTLGSGQVTAIFHLAASGTTAYCALGNRLDGNIVLYYLDCASLSTISLGWQSVGTIAADRKTTSDAFSMCALADPFVAIVYVNDSGGASQLSFLIANTAGSASSTINTSGIKPRQVGIDASQGSTLWVCWDENLNVQLKPYSIVGASLGAAVTINATTTLMSSQRRPPVVLSTGASTAIVYLMPSGVRLLRIGVHHTAGAITTDSSLDMYGLSLASQPFLHNTTPFSLVTADDNVESAISVALADVTDDNSGTMQSVTPHAYFPPGSLATDIAVRPFTLTDGRPAYVVARRSAASVYTYQIVAFDFSDRFRWRTAAHNGATFFTCGLLSYLSTDRVQECGFLQTPKDLSATSSGAGFGPDNAGSYNYVAVFKSVDGAGNLTISGVSDPTSYVGTGSAATLAMDPLVITSRNTRATIAEYYRTTSGGKVYYRVAVSNAMTVAGTLTATDKLDDATLISQPLLYGTGILPGTGGAPLQREAPPYCADVVSFSGMLVVASGSDLWWSGQTIGGEGTWFNSEQFLVTVDGEGDITALVVQDGTLFVFKERAIWTVAGEAPADNGSAGGLGTPRRLAGDVGCIAPSSVVVTSLGIFFQSRRGLELLGRGGSPVWIGEKVQRTLASYPYVTSAALDMRNNLIRFSLASGITDAIVSGDGRDLVYDPVINDWQSVDDKRGSTAHQASQDACTVTVVGVERYAWLAADGTLYTESDTYQDNGVWITMAAETGWFKVAGIQGRQQINRLLTMMRKRTSFELSVALGYNYSTDYDTARLWTYAEIDDLLANGWPLTQLRSDPSDDAEGMSVRVRIEDAFSSDDGFITGTGQGATWLALTLDITPKDGPAEVPEEAA